MRSIHAALLLVALSGTVPSLLRAQAASASGSATIPADSALAEVRRVASAYVEARNRSRAAVAVGLLDSTSMARYAAVQREWALEFLASGGADAVSFLRERWRAGDARGVRAMSDAAVATAGLASQWETSVRHASNGAARLVGASLEDADVAHAVVRIGERGDELLEADESVELLTLVRRASGWRVLMHGPTW